MNTPAPLDTIDYCTTCGDATAHPTITQYDAEVCMCCGRVWGYDGDPSECQDKHVEGAVWWRLLDREQGLTVWTYHVVFGDGEESRVEVGPFTTSIEAVTFAAACMGKTVDEVHRASPVTSEDRETNMGNEVLIGYTVERYDGEETDGFWSLDGGLRR
jgi:hypothetical protein